MSEASRPRRLSASLLVVALTISGAALFAVEQETAVAKSATTQLEALRKTIGAPALQAAVIVNGRIAWSVAVGTANLEHDVSATPATRFRIGSVSKLITVTAAMRLHQDGALDLDAPIQRYVPVFPDKGHPITTRQLAGHLAGVRHYGQNDYLNRVRYNSVTASLASFSADPLRFEPGTGYLYSTFGYTLLSAAIEGASKQEYKSVRYSARCSIRQGCHEPCWTGPRQSLQTVRVATSVRLTVASRTAATSTSAIAGPGVACCLLPRTSCGSPVPRWRPSS